MLAALRNRALVAFAFGHFTNDLFMGVLTGLLPLFKDRLDLSNAQTGLLAFTLSASGSVLQPIFGVLADSIRSRWFPIGIILWDAFFVSLFGVADSFGHLLVICVMLGLGSAAFHPYGASGAARVSDPATLNTSLSLYTVGGTSGFAIGPIATAALVAGFGLRGTFGFLALGVIAAFALGTQVAHIGRGMARVGREAIDVDGRSPQWLLLTRVITIVILRSWSFMTIMVLLPVRFGELGFSAGVYTSVATVMVLSGAVGTIVGGNLADRIGGRRLIVATQLISIPPLLIATQVSDLSVFVFLVLFGLLSDSSLSVTLVAAQRLLPGRTGLASGVILGLGFVGGSVGVPVTGALADRFGLPEALALTGLMPIAAALMALALPATVLGTRELASTTSRGDAIPTSADASA